MIFNILVDAVIWVVLVELNGPQYAHHRMGRVAGESNLVFYADNVWIMGRDTDWVQEELEIIVDMFRRVGMEKNLDKMKAMICTQGLIWVQIREAMYKRRETGEGEKFWERKRTSVSYLECGTEVAASSIRNHLWQSNGVILPQTRGVHVGGGGATTYVVSFPRILKLVECPVIGCTAKAHSAGSMQENFMYRHLHPKVSVMHEGIETLP